MRSSAAIKRAAAAFSRAWKAITAEPETPQDPTNPAHYRSHASGIECIQITEHLGFCLGNAVKYIWRADEREAKTIEDLRKAVWDAGLGPLPPRHELAPPERAPGFATPCGTWRPTE